MIDLAITGGVVATMQNDPLAAEHVAVGVSGGRIVFLGSEQDVPNAAETLEADGRLVTPGLVDCHTHLVYGGDRLADFSRRLGGETYTALAESGMGILSTVGATRSASYEDLLAGATRRARWLARNGVTTVEIKSGYGLTVEDELRMLHVGRQAAANAGLRVSLTLLAAHVVPQDERRSDYVEMVCREMIPAAVGSAEAVDVFVEKIAFTTAEAETIFASAVEHGFSVKAHVGQLTDLGGAQVAARYGATSVDHCEHLGEPAVEALAVSGTVAVLAPGANMFLDESRRPPIDALRRHGVPMAVTTDLNPGSSPLASLPLAAALAVHRFGLTAAEALAAMTVNGARALGRADRAGMLAVGRPADIVVWDLQHPIELTYWLGAPACYATVVGGLVSGWDDA